MISYIKGRVVNSGLNFLVVETAGVGYKVFCAARAKRGATIELHCYHQVREDASDLYGFSAPQDLAVFEMLLSVSGVGPKMALNLVSNLGRDKIIAAIAKNDPSVFKTVSGVGNKVAAKIVVELKNKIAGGGIELPQEDDTIDALLALGLKRDEILPYLRDIPADLSRVEDKVKFVLKNVGKKK